MKELQFSIAIQVTKEEVWCTLWQDETFREWAGMIDPGTYMEGILKEDGNAPTELEGELETSIPRLWSELKHWLKSDEFRAEVSER